MGFSRAALGAAAFVAFALATPRASADPGKPFQFALQNGMQVVVIQDHRAPVVTQMIWFKVGATDDPPGLSGMAHFFEHMMFRGTKAVPGNQFSLTLARNGGESNAFTTHDYTAFYEQVASDRLRLAMSLEADRMANLDLSDPNVATERNVVLEERRMRVDNDPQALTDEQLEAALHLTHPYGRPVIGWPDEIRHIHRAEAQDFYTHHYAPNNAILIVAGDVTVDEVRADAIAEYGKVQARQRVPRAAFATAPRLAETRLTIARADAKVPLFERIYRVPSYDTGAPGEAESYEVLAQLLGGDATSAFYRKLVVERRLATDAGASYDGVVRDAAEFTVYAVPRSGVSLQTLERATDGIIAQFAAKPPAAKDLARAKTQLVASVVYRRDNQYALAAAYGQALAIGLTINDVQTWPDRIQAVTADAVRQAARKGLVLREAATAYLEPATK